MTKTFDEHLNSILSAFDELDLDDEYRRRMAVKPLYDYFLMLISGAGVSLLGMDQNILKSYPVKARWRSVSRCLEQIEDPKRWDELIAELENKRLSVEHNDETVPDKTTLLSIRKRATEFKDWILRVAIQYRQEAGNFPFSKRFSLISEDYVQQADMILQVFGEKLPYLSRSDLFHGEEDPYSELKPSRNHLELKIPQIKSTGELAVTDLDNLVELVKHIERINVKEDLLVGQGICPKCGGKILEYEDEVGGKRRDPKQYSPMYWVACKRCDYRFQQVTIEFQRTPSRYEKTSPT